MQELESQVSALMMALEISAKEKKTGAATEPLIATKAPMMLKHSVHTGSFRQASPMSVGEGSSAKQGASMVAVARNSNSSSPSSTHRGSAAR
jgi:hypothetical protein